MVRDFSQFLPTASETPSRPTRTALQSLGWHAFFAQQIDADAMLRTPPARIVEVHRSGLHVLGDGIDAVLPPRPDATVGDWVLYDAQLPQNSVILDRKSLVKRRAPGHERQLQLIAANIDTSFIVSSCNQDFNVARLERYIALAFEAEIAPVIVLTKSDLTDDPQAYVTQARAISTQVPVVTLDARGGEPLEKLADWCIPGATVAFLGSSGVGKSTLTNALIGTQDIATRGIREDDARGRHTTTHRQLHRAPDGCIVLDTPGMRELQMTEAAAGISDLFDDLTELAGACRFRDCKHDSEPGCAVRAALEREEIDGARMRRWQKLVAEEAFNTASLAERKAKDKKFGRTIKQIQKRNRK